MDNNNNIFSDRQNYQPQPQQVQDPQQYQQPQYQQPVYPQQPYQQAPYQQQPYQQPPYQQAPYQQPVYGQPPYAAAPNQPQKVLRPIDLLPPEERAARKKKATVLCVISLVLQFAPVVILGILEGLIESLSFANSGNISSAPLILQILTYSAGGSYIASWVFMIIARTKYKESVFAKVLMWVYLGILSIGIIGTIILIAMCAYLIRECV